MTKPKNKCDQSPGVMYRIFKKDGSNFSINKTIWPCESSNESIIAVCGKKKDESENQKLNQEGCKHICYGKSNFNKF